VNEFFYRFLLNHPRSGVITLYVAEAVIVYGVVILILFLLGLL
jgi:hypothetical protein